MRNFRRVLFLCVLLEAGLAYQAEAHFRVCHKADQDVMVAYSYYDQRENGWYVAGWYKIPPRSCTKLHIGNVRGNMFYVYAEIPGTSFKWTGDKQLCVKRPDAFRIRAVGQTCDETQKYQEVRTGKYSNYTYTLTVRADQRQAIRDELNGSANVQQAAPPRVATSEQPSPPKIADTPVQKVKLSSPQTCHLEEESGTIKGPDIAVSVEEPAHEVRTGDPVVVKWKVAPIDFKCRTPLYLVLATPMRTRFEGEKFLAFPPRAAAPYRIDYRTNETRILVPLHVGPEELEGRVIVKTYKAGPFRMDWALVEVPKRYADPQTEDDFYLNGGKSTAPTALGKGLSVVGGNPSIVVRDQFSVETPKTIIRSNSGEFELRIFESYYRVFDVGSGELLQERDGWDPNFSPSSRFLGAYSAGAGFEIIDLYSGQVITSNDLMHRKRNFRGNVHMAAWSPEDVFLALSIQGFGGIELQQSLVDGSQRSFPYTSCHYCGGIYSALRVDPEAGIAAYYGQESGWASLLNRAMGTKAAEKQAMAKVAWKPWEADRFKELTAQQQAYLDRRSTLASQIASAALAELGRTSFFKPDPLVPWYNEGETTQPIERNWRFPETMQLSHICLEGRNGKCVGRLVDWQDNLTEPEDTNKRLAKLRVEHAEVTTQTTAAIAAGAVQMADARMLTVRGTKGGNSKEGSDQVKSGARVETDWARLRQLLPAAKDGTAPISISQGDDIAFIMKGNPEEVIAEALPKAAQFLKPSGPGSYSNFDDIRKDAYYGLKKKAQLIDPRTIRQLACGKARGQAYCLVQSFFDNGASSRHWLYLLHGSGTKRAVLDDFTHRLRYRVGRSASGLDEHGNIEITEEFATTMGFGGWPGSVDKVSIAFDRYLIASGLWTIDARRWVLMYNLQTDEIQFFNRQIPEAATLAQIAISEDGRTIVQAHSNGHLYFHDVPTGKLLLRGFDIDDELIVYDPRGYYVATPEGAHFVFLKFPGLPGYNSFQQFATTLSRPDLIAGILAGKTDTPDPQLTSPPTVGLNVEVITDAAKRSAKLKLALASATGLERVRIFVDGRIASDRPITGREAAMELSIDLLPESRWITAVAVDTAGYESVPQGQGLTGASDATKSRLYVISVGTDHYEDSNIKTLSVAKADAENFGRMVKETHSSNYVDVDVTTFLDTAGLRATLPSKIRDIAATAAEHDTIMLFAAGHGFREGPTGKFFLAVRESRLADLEKTSIAWANIATAIEGAKARVFVFIDACKSGSVESSGSNDDAVSSFLNRNASIAVIAASKGRQDSNEIENVGGAFTTALIRSIIVNRGTTDSNNNGVIELTELYGALKRNVVQSTKGEQTPWIARNLMVGEAPLF